VRIFVNGDPSETKAGDVAALVTELGQPPQAVLIEHNGLALRREDWSATTLNDNDRVELLRVVAGG
jgi:thiamine biosynthesis protein ThiS